jgi:hypothetical protein
MKALAYSFLIWLGLTLGAMAQGQCVVPAGAAATPVVSTSTTGSLVLKAAPGCILSLYVTSAGSAGYFMQFNSATVPADGTVAPRNCIYVPANTTMGLNWAPQPPEWNSAGISVAFSTVGCQSKTLTGIAFIHGLVQ